MNDAVPNDLRKVLLPGLFLRPPAAVSSQPTKDFLLHMCVLLSEAFSMFSFV